MCGEYIEASNRYYGFDIVPAFWTWLDQKQQAGDIASIKYVYDELTRGDDALSDWAKTRKGSNWWLDVSDTDVQNAYKEIIAWVMASTHFTQAAKDQFLAEADPWLIAKATAIDAIIVTHEGFDPNRKNKVTIPIVCQHFGVKCLDTFDLIRSFGDMLGL
ncbi:DUF4411 family protein [methane-oxidizing endosymbiont of Gigantopelta aegis]|uniref:DUF4411 family protein n=1 Tax=methane-oxidizing endosymbiont of Gigantopelta aegis TaxID=2794938 RepID=UPI0018DB5A68|nr:DUF4411 family protein [methane-oxidizing endosymbiont of Gigantopelta aegis]